MKIGVLTQPFATNYGGILQNYALQTILKREGFKVNTINRCVHPASNMMRLISILKRVLLKFFFRKNIIIRVIPTKKESAIINHNINSFIRDNIILTEKLHNNISRIVKKYKFNAYIVGSDQVWRPKYSPCITSYFFDFLDEGNKEKKIAYAASFGVDDWEFTAEQTVKCSNLAKNFNAISVREESAVELCKKYLDIKAIQVLDPTMLLKKEDYINLIKSDNIQKRENVLFSYILDKSEEKNCFIQKIAKEFELQQVAGMPSNSFHLKKSKKDLSDCVFLSIPEWIAGFRDAKFVITDSFHGAVFSILFNKPFVVFNNKERGNARLNSLLKMFKIENRLITSTNFDNNLFYHNYFIINNILEQERNKSISFLLNELKYEQK